MSARFEIVQTNAEQPWHARFVAANGEAVWSTENYADVRGAEDAVALLADALGSEALFEGVKPRREHPRPAPVVIGRVDERTSP